MTSEPIPGPPRVGGEELARGAGHAVWRAAVISASACHQAEGRDEGERRRAPKAVQHRSESEHVCLLCAPSLRGESYNSLSGLTRSGTRKDPAGQNSADMRLTAHAAGPFRTSDRKRLIPPDARGRPRIPLSPRPEIGLACIRIGLRLDRLGPVADARRRAAAAFQMAASRSTVSGKRFTRLISKAACAFGLARPCSQFSSVRTLVRR